MTTKAHRRVLGCAATALLLAPWLAGAATPAATGQAPRAVQSPRPVAGQQGQPPASNARTSQPASTTTAGNKPAGAPTAPTNTGGGTTPKPTLLEFQIPEKVIAAKPGKAEEQTQRTAVSPGKPGPKSFTLDGKGTDVNVEEIELVKSPNVRIMHDGQLEENEFQDVRKTPAKQAH